MELSQQLLKLPELIQMVRKSRASIYADISAGLFPAPIRTGKRSVAWQHKDISRWIQSCVSTKTQPQK